MRGIRTAIVADLDLGRARRAFQLCGHRAEDIVSTNRLSEAADAIRRHRPVATEDADLVPALDIDAVVEATGNTEIGADVALRAIQARRHIIMLNVETDVVVGPILHRMAKNSGVVYTVSSGDEPGLIAEYFDRYSSLGFEIVAVGKAPSSVGLFDRYATPDSVGEDARRLGINPHFLVTFRDATKTMIEMACISNYTGLVPDIRGMHGPIAGVNEIPKIFRPTTEGGILNHRGVVDYARPLKHPDGKIDFDRSVTPGVFLVVYTDHTQIREDLGYLDVTGSDGYYIMYTPYHLVTNEIPLSIVHAVEYGHPTIVPKLGMVTEVFGAAKRPLKAGEVLEGPGGSSVYALNDAYETTRQENVVPLGLLPGARLLRDVRTDQPITYDLVELRRDTALYHLRALQDATLARDVARDKQDLRHAAE
jgi:predicted homoserine dehydrogenase-like protein